MIATNGENMDNAYGMRHEAEELLLINSVAGGGIRVVIVEGSDVLSNVARHVECSVFHEFFAAEPESEATEYAPYERASMFFVAVDTERKAIAGVLRVVRHSEAGWKTLNDLDLASLAAAVHGLTSACWDVATLAVPKAYRGRGDVSGMLYGATYVAAVKAGIEHIVAVLDEHCHRHLVDVLGLPFVPLAGAPARAYLGSSKCQPVYLHVPGVLEAFVKREGERVAAVLRGCDLQY